MFSTSMVKHTAKLKIERFFLNKTTVLWFKEKWSSEAIDGMFYLSINQSFP